MQSTRKSLRCVLRSNTVLLYLCASVITHTAFLLSQFTIIKAAELAGVVYETDSTQDPVLYTFPSENQATKETAVSTTQAVVEDGPPVSEVLGTIPSSSKGGRKKKQLPAPAPACEVSINQATTETDVSPTQAVVEDGPPVSEVLDTIPSSSKGGRKKKQPPAPAPACEVSLFLKQVGTLFLRYFVMLPVTDTKVAPFFCAGGPAVAPGFGNMLHCQARPDV